MLALLFGQPDRDFFVTEMITLAGSGRGAVQRELARLAGSGLAVVSQVGNRKYYRANRDSPLFDEIRGIVRKTVGMEESIRDALEPLADSLVLALLYGSIARRTDTAASDVDLLLVSDELTLEAVYAALAPVEMLLGRHVNPTIYTSGEFQRRSAAKAGFLTRVLEGRHVILMGSLDGAEHLDNLVRADGLKAETATADEVSRLSRSRPGPAHGSVIPGQGAGGAPRFPAQPPTEGCR